MTLDLSVPIRDALVASAAVQAALPTFAGSLAVFTRAPVDANAPYPMIVTQGQFGGGDEDGTADLRPIVVRDVVVYGRNDTAAHYRAVVALADDVWALFHRRPTSLVVPDWTVIDVRASQPAPAPVDDPQEEVARRVGLTVRLARRD